MIATRIGVDPRPRLYASTTDTCDGDLDLIAIEYALNGEPVTLTKAEKIYAARILDGYGYDATSIGRRIGSDRQTVLDWKVNHWKPGGGLSRERIRREPPQCGTRGGYQQHRRHKEPACQPCRDANSAADRQYRLTGTTKGVG